MRRFSQRSSLVTLSEINITPLLDLAFVLLIIFVITTPLLEQSINMKLPTGGVPDKPLDKRDIATVEISTQGVYALDRRRMSNLDQLERELVQMWKGNQNLVVYIRADEEGRNKDLYAVIDRCQRNGITRYSLRTEPPTRRNSNR
jgi:biopolymer transport protein ExbD